MKTTFWKKWMLAAVAAVSAACLFVTPALAAGSATTEENPTQLSWAKMSTGEARYDAGANTMTFVSEEFKITPMLYSSRGEGAYADSPYAEYNDTEYRFTFNVKPNGSYDDFVLDDPDEGEWYAAFSFRNPSVGAAGQEWEATFASFFLLKENYTAIRISSGSTASSDALWFKIPRRVKGTDGTWKTDET